MRIFRSRKWVSQVAMLGLPLLFLAGCAHHTGGAESGSANLAAGDEAYASGTGDQDGFEGQDMARQGEAEMVSGRIYYFDYDKDDIKPDAMTQIEMQAKYLVANPEAKVRVEGHCDERGSREYNVGLAERRAQSVSKVLMVKGVKKSQVSIVSYGKERPAVQGHDESAWKWNRRAKIVYEANGPKGGDQ